MKYFLQHYLWGNLLLLYWISLVSSTSLCNGAVDNFHDHVTMSPCSWLLLTPLGKGHVQFSALQD